MKHMEIEDKTQLISDEFSTVQLSTGQRKARPRGQPS